MIPIRMPSELDRQAAGSREKHDDDMEQGGSNIETPIAGEDSFTFDLQPARERSKLDLVQSLPCKQSFTKNRDVCDV